METPETHTAFAMSENEKNYTAATEALKIIGDMTTEMEKNYEEKIEKLQNQFDDACKQAERYLTENHELKKQLADKALNEVKDAMSDVLEEENEQLTETLDALYTRAEKLENTVKELQTENDGLVYEIGGLIAEAQEARRSFTTFQIAVSILVFLYGMMYGKYIC